jgi:hypothetical protein
VIVELRAMKRVRVAAATNSLSLPLDETAESANLDVVYQRANPRTVSGPVDALSALPLTCGNGLAR